MCGIAGCVGDAQTSSLAAGVQSMVRSLARRGPDSEGTAQWPGAVLGHRRLAILDLSDAGKQPMLSTDGDIGVVFNGCIYNFLELRNELEKAGYFFRSQCDTEVLIHGYRHWGIDRMVGRLRGMFAFGIWDNPRRTLLLVRDRLGVKPLLYAATGKQIAFASTITALREAGVTGDVDPAAVLEYLEFGWVSDDSAIFEGVTKVPAASIVEWHDGTLKQRSYWNPPAAGLQSLSFDEAVERTGALVVEAVKLRLISDVPVGALLSGGIDSALVCWALAKLNANLTAFTVGTPRDPADESGAARRTAELLGIPHEIIELPPDQLPDVSELVSAYGEPFACSSALGMLRVCKAVKPKVTVLLTGDGGDDVFLGYTHHKTFLTAQRLARSMPAMAARLWPHVRAAIPKTGTFGRAVHLLDYATGGLGAATSVHDGLPYYENSGLIGDRLKARRLSHREIPLSFDSARDMLADYLEYERRTRFVSEYMTKVDGGAMHYAVEARSPFLDQVLWEFAAALPFNLRLRNGELKAVLRGLVRKEIGSEVADRRKQGFTIPVSRWLANAWRPQLEALRNGSLLENEGWVRRGALQSAIDKALATGNAPTQLWSLMVLDEWMRKHSVRATVAC